jgi:hypothetical protein
MPVLSVIDSTNYLQQKEFFDAKDTDVIFYGGSGSGKSYSVVDKLILQVYINEAEKKPVKMIISRKALPSLKKSVLPIFDERTAYWGIKYKLNKQDMIAKIGEKSEIYFVTMNNPSDYEKVNLIKVIYFPSQMGDYFKPDLPNIEYTEWQLNNPAAMDGWYSWVDIMVLPSYIEGYSTVSLECLAKAIPTVARNIPGLYEPLKWSANFAETAPEFIEAIKRVEIRYNNESKIALNTWGVVSKFNDIDKLINFIA